MTQTKREFLKGLAVMGLGSPIWIEPSHHYPGIFGPDDAARLIREFPMGPDIALVNWKPDFPDDPMLRFCHGVIEGVRLEFTGWIADQRNTLLFGHWKAWTQEEAGWERRFFYASCPGGEGEYRIGDHFDIGQRGVQRTLHRDSPRKDFELMFGNGFMRLMRVLREHKIIKERS